MHDVVLQVGTVWLSVLVIACAPRVLRAASASSRILALDTLVLVLIGLLALLTYSERVPFFLDAALVVAMLAFVGTVAGARFHDRGRVF